MYDMASSQWSGRRHRPPPPPPPRPNWNATLVGVTTGWKAQIFAHAISTAAGLGMQGRRDSRSIVGVEPCGDDAQKALSVGDSATDFGSTARRGRGCSSARKSAPLGENKNVFFPAFVTELNSPNPPNKNTA